MKDAGLIGAAVAMAGVVVAVLVYFVRSQIAKKSVEPEPAPTHEPEEPETVSQERIEEPVRLSSVDRMMLDDFIAELDATWRESVRRRQREGGQLL